MARSARGNAPEAPWPGRARTGIVEDMTINPAYFVFLGVVVLAMTCGLLALRYLRQYACLFCGTRNGKHAPDCRWAQDRLPKGDE